MHSYWTSRTEILIKKENREKLQQLRVLVAGLGGVGSFAAEMLCRAGVGTITIIDGDVIQPSNRNRQIHAFLSTEGKSKTEVMEARLKDINPEVHIENISRFVKDDEMETLLEGGYDYIVDAIDTLAPKISLIYQAVQKQIPIISSMGCGGRMDPSQVKVDDVSKSYNCKLAFMLRKKLHQKGIYTGFQVVFSTEQIAKEAVYLTEGEKNKKSSAGTISYMPALFGLYCASEVIREITGK